MGLGGCDPQILGKGVVCFKWCSTLRDTRVLPEKSIFLNCVKKSKVFGNLSGKSKFFGPGSMTPTGFQTRLTPQPLLAMKLLQGQISVTC